MGDELPKTITPLRTARHVIEEAIEAWRDGETADAIHPQLDLAGSAWLWNPDTVKDLARVIRDHLEADGNGKAH